VAHKLYRFTTWFVADPVRARIVIAATVVAVTVLVALASGTGAVAGQMPGGTWP
jgi:hypothetical protein